MLSMFFNELYRCGCKWLILLIVLSKNLWFLYLVARRMLSLLMVYMDSGIWTFLIYMLYIYIYIYFLKNTVIEHELMLILDNIANVLAKSYRNFFMYDQVLFGLCMLSLHWLISKCQEPLNLQLTTSSVAPNHRGWPHARKALLLVVRAMWCVYVFFSVLIPNVKVGVLVDRILQIEHQFISDP